MHVLIVLTSHDRPGDTGEMSGFWLEEFAGPCYRLRDGGATITLACPKGGQPPLDPKSHAPEIQTDATRRLEADAQAEGELANTRMLSELGADDFDAVFCPGGHGPFGDLSGDANSIALIERFIAQDKPVATVCRAPAVLVSAKGPDCRSLTAGKRATGFSDSEEAAAGLTDVVPFLVEDGPARLGTTVEKTDDWQPRVVVDGSPITGRDPASSEGVADALVHVRQSSAERVWGRWGIARRLRHEEHDLLQSRE